MEMPKIGDWIDNEKAIDLCVHFCRTHEGFCKIARRISDYPNDFKPWEFDGASCVPDELFADSFNIPLEKFIVPPLRHDLKFAYGIPGDDEAILIANCELCIELVEIGLSAKAAKLARNAVEAFGEVPSKFSWGFARK